VALTEHQALTRKKPVSKWLKKLFESDYLAICQLQAKAQYLERKTFLLDLFT
jgi:hypothetical protein